MNTPMTRDESVRILGLENNIESIKDDIGMDFRNYALKTI